MSLINQIGILDTPHISITKNEDMDKSIRCIYWNKNLYQPVLYDLSDGRHQYGISMMIIKNEEVYSYGRIIDPSPMEKAIAKALKEKKRVTTIPIGIPLI